MSIPKADKWILVEWNSGGQSVVNIRYLIKSLPVGEEVKIGKVVTIGRKDDGSPLTATVLASARDRHQLDKPPQEETRKQPTAGTSAQREEPKDYSPSASDWEPSDDSSSEESEENDEDESKVIKLGRPKARQYRNLANRKAPTPRHRPAAIIPNGVQQRAVPNLKNRKRKQNNMSNYGFETQPDSKIKLDVKFKAYEGVIDNMKEMFQELFRIMRKTNPSFNVDDIETTRRGMARADQAIDDTIKDAQIEVAEEKSDSEYSDRSDDNVLITNKYDSVMNKNGKTDSGEWVPIGSGTTLIHKDKYRKVNWKSYTIATRTLLLAAFSRRTLATHSLTGKRSPAFTDKPAKMCLDPKIVSDIVIEITDKFNVKDNLVRSIITTKCADECKMQRMKMKKKAKNQENIPPQESNTTDN